MQSLSHLFPGLCPDCSLRDLSLVSFCSDRYMSWFSCCLFACLAVHPSLHPSPSICPSVRPSVRFSILTQLASGLSYMINFFWFCYCCYISILSTYGIGKSLEPKKKKKKKIEGFIRNGVNKCPWFECFIDSLGSCSRARLLQPVKKRTRHILCKLCCPDG